MEPSKLSLFQVTASRETSKVKIAGSFGVTLFMRPRINFTNYNTKFSTQGLSCLSGCVCVVCALSHVCERGRHRIVIITSIHFLRGVCDYVLCAAASVWSSEDSLQGSVLSFHHEGLRTLTRFLRLGSMSLSTTEPSPQSSAALNRLYEFILSILRNVLNSERDDAFFQSEGVYLSPIKACSCQA